MQGVLPRLAKYLPVYMMKASVAGSGEQKQCYGIEARTWSVVSSGSCLVREERTYGVD
jgi:hypothetical protein